jgi:hypothetical protein
MADLDGVPEVLSPRRRGGLRRAIALDEFIKKSCGMKNLDTPLSCKPPQRTRCEQIEALAVKRRAIKDDSHECQVSDWRNSPVR